MTCASPEPSHTSDAISVMPSWVTSARAEAIEDAAFFSGAALSHLQGLMRPDAVPRALMRDRLALRASEVRMVQSGRPERAGQLRDAFHFLRPGDLPGPAGEVYLAWQRAVERPLSVMTLARALPDVGVERIAGWLDTGPGAPVMQAASVLEAVLAEAPGAERFALILADAVLARALGWEHLVPVLAIGLTRGDLRRRGADLRLACHRAAISAAGDSVRLVSGLSRQADGLKAISPKLRAKGAEAAVEVFLTRDAVAPAALPLPDRAARRLCDRLVDLGAVRELTGRDSFRLYGV